MLGFQRFDTTVIDHRTQHVTVQRIWQFIGFLLNPRWWSGHYSLIMFSGKDSLRDAHYAKAQYIKRRDAERALTVEQLEPHEQQTGNIQTKLYKAQDVVTQALAKAANTEDTLHIELKL